MPRIPSFLWRAALGVAFLVLAHPASFAQSTAPSDPIDPETKKSVLERVGAIVQNSAYVPGVEFSRWREFLAKHQDAIDKASSETEFSEAINEDLSKFFGISHIVLITPKAAKARSERKTVGIGIQVQPEEGGLRVVGVFDNTPAKDAGLLPGDLIFEADGKKVTGVPSMMGDEGSVVTIKLKRDDSTKEYKLTRRKYSNIRPDTLAWADSDTALVKIHTFDFAYDRKKVEALMTDAFRAKGMILDLRSNGGGSVLNMLHLIGFFLPSDTKIGSFVSRSMVNQFVEETGGKSTELRAIATWAERGALRPGKNALGMFKGNVAVLVNGGTGSASEITASALHEFREAPIVGTKSAGAVLVSVMAPLPGGWMLQYPMMDYITSQGVRLEGTGVEPEVEAPTPRFKEPDTAIEKAVALLKRTALRNQRSSTPPPRKRVSQGSRFVPAPLLAVM